MPDILILTLSTGGGHDAAARALVQALGRGTIVRPPQLRGLEIWHRQVGRLAPSVLGWGYALDRLPWVPALLYGLHLKLHRWDLGSPRLVVSVHPVVTQIVARLPRTFPLATLVTDLVETHPSCYHPRADLCLVAGEEQRRQALARGVRRVRVTGLPVPPLQEPAAEGPLVLVVGGGEGHGKAFPRVVEALARTLPPEVRLVAVCGRNEPLRKRLASSRVEALGFVDNLGSWMAAADVLVTKAGPGTLAEAFCYGLPVLVFGYLPNEEGNIRLLEEARAGLYLSDPQQLAAQAVAWLRHQPKPPGSRGLARPEAAARAARELLTLLG